ncbi:MAG: DUF6588 family protein [Bdellovibrionota bacterium]
MKILNILIVFLFPFSVFADPNFDSIDQNDLKEISKSMGANFTHNSMMGASKMGTLFGFQVGVTAARTSTPKLDDIAKRNGGELPALYNAGLMGAVGVPFGISIEAVLIPKVSAGDSDVQSTSLGVKWNINEVVPVLPVNVAVRGFYSKAELSFAQTVSAQNATVKNETNVTGLQLLVSPMLPLIEPYVGIGYLKVDNELGVTGTTGTIFDYTLAQSDSKKESSTQFLVGVEGSLALFKLGAEFSRAFDANRIGVKIALGF